MTTDKKKSPRSGGAGGPKTVTERLVPGEINDTSNDTSPATDAVSVADFANVTKGTKLDYFWATDKDSKIYTAGTITWGELIEMAKNPDDHKECGLYVLGRFKGKRRTNATLIDRCALTLDVDAPKPSFLVDALLELDGTAAIIHPTYSSTVDKPRYRIIIPLTESVDADTYAATVNAMIDRLASDDKKQIDARSASPVQGMYKPSTQDLEHYTCEVLKGAALEPSAPQEDAETSSEDEQTVAKGTGDTTPFADLSEEQQKAAREDTNNRIAAFETLLAAAVGWDENERDEKGRGWEGLTMVLADTLHRLAVSPWCPLSEDELKREFHRVLPPEIAEAESEGMVLKDKWKAKRNGSRARGPWPAPWEEASKSAREDFGPGTSPSGSSESEDDKPQGAQRRGHKAQGAQRRGRPSTAEILVGMARSHFRFARGEDGDAFAIGDESPHIAELVGDNSKSPWARKLNRMFLERENRPPNGEALGAAVLTGQGMADSLEPVKVWRRTARNGGDIWIDLGDSDNHVIHLDSTGWNLQDTAPVMFRRSGISRAFPVPVDAGQGSLDPLWRHVNATMAQRPLLLAWLINAIIRPDGEQPLLTIDGEKGSGKTFGTRAITALVDPLSVKTLSPPRDDADWVSMARSRWCVPVDNISSISHRWSDQLARTATGSGEAGRALYTRSDLSASMMLNPVILNGITFGRIQSDLADRMVLLQLKRIPPEHRLDSEQQRDKWAQDYPVILGGLLDLAVQVHRVLDTVPRPPGGLARMTSYAKVLLGVDAVLGTEGYSEYRENAVALARAGIEGDPFMLAILSAITKPWSGTAKELLRKAKNASALDDDSDGKWTMMTSQGASRALKRMAGDLREIGWKVENRYDSHRKVYTWSLEPPA